MIGAHSTTAYAAKEEFVSLVRRLIRDNGLTYPQLADGCRQIEQAAASRPIVHRVTRDWLARLAGDPANRPKVHDDQIETLASYFNIPVPWLWNYRGVLHFEALHEAAQAQQLGQLLRLAKKSAATRMLSWARFLPCSLETQSFMKAFHRRRYGGDKRTVAAGRAVAAAYDEMGMASQQEIVSDRSWMFVHIMFVSDFENIVRGTWPFDFDRDVRLKCVGNLIELTTTRDDIDLLFIGDDANARELSRQLDGLSSIFVVEGERALAQWQIGNGEVYVSVDAHRVKLQRERLQALRQASDISAKEAVRSYLERQRRRLVKRSAQSR